MLPSSAFGISADFPKQQFENAIRFAMQMGTPNDPDKRPIFIFPTKEKTYWRDDVQIPTPHLDADGRPLDPNIEMRISDPIEKEGVLCAIEVETSAAVGEIPVGKFPSTRLVITLLEAEWEEVVGCDGVRYNGDYYVYDHEPQNYGLFDSNVHTMIFVSEDET